MAVDTAGKSPTSGQAVRFVVRLPGATEYWLAERTPAIGDTFARLGTEYAVTAVDESDPDCAVITVVESG